MTRSRHCWSVDANRGGSFHAHVGHDGWNCKRSADRCAGLCASASRWRLAGRPQPVIAGAGSAGEAAVRAAGPGLIRRFSATGFPGLGRPQDGGEWPSRRWSLPAGRASTGNAFTGRKTASGEAFHHENLSAASNRFPLGTLVAVRRPFSASLRGGQDQRPDGPSQAVSSTCRGGGGRVSGMIDAGGHRCGNRSAAKTPAGARDALAPWPSCHRHACPPQKVCGRTALLTPSLPGARSRTTSGTEIGEWAACRPPSNAAVDLTSRRALDRGAKRREYSWQCVPAC
jgi:hypothetical protein